MGWGWSGGRLRRGALGDGHGEVGVKVLLDVAVGNIPLLWRWCNRGADIVSPNGWLSPAGTDFPPLTAEPPGVARHGCINP